jgi:NTP pyrophosphatase (non-canonical NTP hydrolase)
MSFTISTGPHDYKIIGIHGEFSISAFKELVHRATNLWPDAPAEIKEFADMITVGHVQQDYHTQDTSKQQNVAKTLSPLTDPVAPLSLNVGRMEAGNTIPLGTARLANGARITYGEFVATLAKKLPTEADDLMHAAVGISGEAGELLDAIKKHWVYNKPLDYENIKEELGDLLFYITAMMLLTRVDLQGVLDANIQKLQKRYPGMNYSDAAAQARVDKIWEKPVTAN